VIHHTDCGMELFTSDIIANLLSKSLETATVDENGWRNVREEGGSGEGKFINFLTFKNLENSVTEDVKRIKSHPLVDKAIPVYGYIYDVRSGKLIEVPEATEAGKV
jgi:carbonic anhydrase